MNTYPRKGALVTGTTGQDGAYLAELLLAKGNEVHGIRRRAARCVGPALRLPGGTPSRMSAMQATSRSPVRTRRQLPPGELPCGAGLASACLLLLHRYSGEDLVNVGSGHEVSISDLARRIADTMGYCGTLKFDPSRPDGTPRKLLDSSRLITLGWEAARTLDVGLAEACSDARLTALT